MSGVHEYQVLLTGQIELVDYTDTVFQTIDAAMPLDPSEKKNYSFLKKIKPFSKKYQKISLFLPILKLKTIYP